MPAGRTRGIAAWVATFVVCLALWLLLTATVAWNEVLTGVLAAALAATASSVVGREDKGSPAGHRWRRFRLAGGWRAVAVLPWRVVADTVVAVAALVDRLRGRPVGELHAVKAGGASLGYQTSATLLVSMSANQLVADFDEAGQVAWVHSLRPRGRESIEEILRRP
ncbi:MAG: hypothetical protein ACRDZ8_04875 [Acidimicrobiales bacterium]